MYTSKSPNFSFNCIVLISAIFFAGYFLLKCPLAFVLHKQHVSLLQAYSISSTANILMAIVSVLLGTFFKENTNQKFFLFLGVLFSTLAIFLLKTFNFIELLCGIGFYVLGGSLYFFNIIIYINKLLADSQTRQAGNYKYQIWINIGGFLGGLLFILEYNNDALLNEYSLFTCIISLLFFALVYRDLKDESFNKKNLGGTAVKLLTLYLFIFICLYFGFATQLISFFVFIIAIGYGLYLANKGNNLNYFTLILLVLFFSVPYWLGYTILFNEFFHLLDKNSYRVYGLTANSIILIDPLANVVFGCFVLKLYQKRASKPLSNLSIGMVFLAVSFIVLVLGLFHADTPQTLLPIYPIITVLLFSCGEFLIQSTLNASVKNLLTKNENINFSMGILRSSRACAAALGYFFTWLTVREGLMSENIVSVHESHLYIITAGYILVSLAAYYYFKKRIRLVC
jgi:hypothetical protein